jgi:hypothetical protein
VKLRLWLGGATTERCAVVASIRTGQVATACALGCAALGLWELLLSVSISGRHADWEWAVALNDIYLAVARRDADPIKLSFGFMALDLFIVTTVGVVVYSVTRRASSAQEEGRPLSLVCDVAILASLWLLNAQAVLNVVTIPGAWPGAWAYRVIALLGPALCAVAVAVALSLCCRNRLLLGGAAALAAGILTIAMIYWLRSPLHWGYQAVCGASVGVLFMMAAMQHTPRRQATWVPQR